ncbi:MAG: three-helix bundle dimerization domain-containing protein [Acidobacteriota bacterium]
MNLDEIVDEIWRELGQCCSREHIRKVTVQAAAEFSEAKVTSYLPIFIRRATFQQLVLLC